MDRKQIKDAHHYAQEFGERRSRYPAEKPRKPGRVNIIEPE